MYEIFYDNPEFEIGDSVSLFNDPKAIGEVVGSDFGGEEVIVSWGDKTTNERARDLVRAGTAEL